MIPIRFRSNRRSQHVGSREEEGVVCRHPTASCLEGDTWEVQRRHNGTDSVSNHQHHHCLLNRLFGCWSKKTSKLRITGLCAGNSPGTGEFPAQMASNAKNVAIWWRHHESNVSATVCSGVQQTTRTVRDCLIRPYYARIRECQWVICA